MNSGQFHRLSLDLVGEPNLDVSRAAGLLQRLLTVVDAQTLERLHDVAAALPADSSLREQAIDVQIMSDPALRGLAKTIIVLWYTGDLVGSATIGPTEEQYFAALVWPVARAHPPGLSGGYFGHWTYPPDN